MIQTLLITGAAGYIGSFVNKLLLERGFQTIILDNLSKGKKEYVVGGELIVGNFGDRQLLKTIFKRKIDAVLHFAAHTDVGESVLKPFKYYENNVVNTLILLEEMEKAAVKKLIFSSSAAVYGHPEEEPIRETARQKPINPYGETKRVVEEMIRWTNFDAISLRYFNAAGADPDGKLLYRNPSPTNLIPILLNGLSEQKPFTLFGEDYPTEDGTCVRDYIHIYDLATGHLLALEALAKGKKGAYNLGNGKGYSVLQVVAAVEKVTGKKVNLIRGPRREGDPTLLLADATKARQELGWQTRYPGLEQMVHDAWLGYAAAGRR